MPIATEKTEEILLKIGSHIDSNAFSLQVQIHGTPIVAGRVKSEILSVDLEKLNLDEFTLKPSASSTPRTVETGQSRPIKFDTPKDCLNCIQQEFTEEIPHAHLETFLEQKIATLIRSGQ